MTTILYPLVLPFARIIAVTAQVCILCALAAVSLYSAGYKQASQAWRWFVKFFQANHHSTTFSGHDKDEGFASYPLALLYIYDITLIWNNNMCWGVSTSVIQSFFDAALTRNHVDIGVGNGANLARSKTLMRFSQSDIDGHSTLDLWDLNPDPLVHSKNRIAQACTQATGHVPHIETHTVDIIDPESVENAIAVCHQGQTYDSVTMFYLFHCIPNPSVDVTTQSSKASVAKFTAGFKNVARVLAKGGVVSGTTLVTYNDVTARRTIGRGRFAMGETTMKLYHGKHFFNQFDTMETVTEGAKAAGLVVRSLVLKGFVCFFVLVNEL